MANQTRLTITAILGLAIVISMTLAANDPGHDTLYIEEQGNSVLNGTLNVTGNLSTVANLTVGGSQIQQGVLAFYSDGRTVSSGTGIVSGSNNIYIEASGNLYLKANTGPNQVVVGTSTAVALNVSGALYVGGLNYSAGLVCLSNGSNCPSSLGGANLTGNAATAGYLTQWQNSSVLNNSIITQTATGIGIGTASPTQKLDVNGSINISSTTGTLYVNGTRAAGIGTCTGNDVIQNISEKGATCITPTAAGDGNNYTNSIGFSATGSTLQLNLNRTGMNNLTSTITMNDTTRAITGTITCTGTQVLQNITLFNNGTNAANCTTPTATGDGNNYTSNISFNRTGNTVQLNLNITGMNNLTATFTDTNTSYTNSTGLSLSGTTFSVLDYLSYTLANNTYPLRSTWTTIDNYPTYCTANSYVTGVNDTLQCYTISGANISNSLNWINSTYGNNTYYNTSNPLNFINSTYGNNTYQTGTEQVNYTTTIGFNSTGTTTQLNLAQTGTSNITATFTDQTSAGGNASAQGATAGYIPQFQNTTVLNNSIMTQTTTGIGISTAAPIATLTVSGNFSVSGTTNSSLDSGTLFIDATNNRVGIGDTSPTEKFSIASGNIKLSNNQFLTQLNSGGGAYNVIGYSSSDLLQIGNSGAGGPNDSIVMYTQAGERMRINYGGNVTVDSTTLSVDATNDKVGIGTATPTQKLSVVGNINATGYNVSTINCIIFDSGGKICSGT